MTQFTKDLMDDPEVSMDAKWIISYLLKYHNIKKALADAILIKTAIWNEAREADIEFAGAPKPSAK